VNVAVETAGDCLARAKVRFREMRESLRISRNAIDGMPEGPICSYKPIRSRPR